MKQYFRIRLIKPERNIICIDEFVISDSFEACFRRLRRYICRKKLEGDFILLVCDANIERTEMMTPIYLN
jgi:hypothetical protein